MKSSLKPFIEFGPLAVFFYYFIKTGEIQSAILPLMIAAGIAIVLSLIFEKKVPPMLLFSTILIFIFGSLTIYFNDPFFIKFKVTLVNFIFAVILFVGLYFKKPLLKNLMGSSIKLTDYGWVQLSKRWAYFFLFLSACNEFVYRNFSDTIWVNFKLFGIMGLTFVFIFSQAFFIQKNLSDQ
jgi:intracellular septation protein